METVSSEFLFWTSILANITTLIGVPAAFIAVLRFLRVNSRAARIVPFKGHGPIDIVVGTSTEVVDPRGVRRGATGHGALVGIEKASKFLSRYHPRKAVRISICFHKPPTLRPNLVLIGGPAKNEVARKYLAELNRHYGDVFSFHSGKDDRYLRVNGASFPPDAKPNEEDKITDLDFLMADPEKPGQRMTIYDYGVVVVAPNPMSVKGNVVLLYGFSTEGTAATAEWFFDELCVTNLAKVIEQRMKINRKVREGYVIVLRLRQGGINETTVRVEPRGIHELFRRQQS